ncbi:alpha/beta hydrolase [Oxynema aestuarii]|jgi:fermentation-respiration switch protein FrsA (DUF1100 family)|uniref:Alpha/beta hydrolase n=1 Tax=Oxynema aestuarii AP17 TaxID=2064643 RepID=A0A6H1TY21_9CYAN|nr:alpha/beta hydrolase [Oxynema aestuarii]QIZ71116.1 alpha/beta hydrolase [Oxynema aestuarii AP17]RMH76909.1 MAG: alpha/beta hydrolase [Cyanobacteria bacterium J007]
MDKQKLKRLLVGEFSLKRLVKSAVSIYLLLACYAYFLSDWQIFQPPEASYRDGPEILKLKSGEDTWISAIYLVAPDADYTVLYSHGNAEDLGDVRSQLEAIRRSGFSVFAYDYRGYGTSEGRPSEANAYRDIEAAYRYLTGSRAIASDRILVYGRSVGSGPSVDLAARYPVGGLILESAFTSVFGVVFPFPVFPFDKFNNIRKITQVTCPVLVIHGREDTVIPFAHGRRLWEAAPEPKLFLAVDGAGHNDVIEVAGDRIAEAWQQFSRLVGDGVR